MNTYKFNDALTQLIFQRYKTKMEKQTSEFKDVQGLLVCQVSCQFVHDLGKEQATNGKLYILQFADVCSLSVTTSSNQ